MFVFPNESIPMDGRHTKTKYVNICKYVDSLKLYAVCSRTIIVAQMGARWIAVLYFLSINSGRVFFFYFKTFVFFVINSLFFISLHFQSIL